MLQDMVCPQVRLSLSLQCHELHLDDDMCSAHRHYHGPVSNIHVEVDENNITGMVVNVPEDEKIVAGR